jgi:hypothetical protein
MLSVWGETYNIVDPDFDDLGDLSPFHLVEAANNDIPPPPPSPNCHSGPDRLPVAP